MKIFVINPNTSTSMTDHLRREVLKIKRPDTTLTVMCPDRGPYSIESAYEEAISISPSLKKLIRKAMTSRKERIVAKREEVYARGLDYFPASVRSLDLSVAETNENPEKTKNRILEVAAKAVEENGAEVIILGCAGMAGYAPEIEAKLKVKVVDPSSIAFQWNKRFPGMKWMHWMPYL